MASTRDNFRYGAKMWWGSNGVIPILRHLAITEYVLNVNTSVVSQHDDFSPKLSTWKALYLPEWRWRAAHSSSPAAGWPCSESCCSRPRSGSETALWWGAGGWSTGRAADTVSARRWAGGQTARSPGTHSEQTPSQSMIQSVALLAVNHHRMPRPHVKLPLKQHTNSH